MITAGMKWGQRSVLLYKYPESDWQKKKFVRPKSLRVNELDISVILHLLLTLHAAFLV